MQWHWRGDRTLSAWFIVFLAVTAILLGEVLPVWLEHAPPGTPGAKESMFASVDRFVGTVVFYTVLATLFWLLYRTLHWLTVAGLAALVGTSIEWFWFRPQEVSGPNVVKNPLGALLFFLVIWPILLVLPFAVYQAGRRYGWRWVALAVAIVAIVAVIFRPDLPLTNQDGSPIRNDSLAANPPVEDDTTASWWQPAPGLSFQWQLTGLPVDTSVEADVYEIDGLDNSRSVVEALHTKGRRVVCYVDVGSWEEFRADAGDFPEAVIGNTYTGYPDERWLDVRQIDALAPILGRRFDACRDKGFDAIEADNVDGFEQNTGFPLTAADQLAFNRWVAAEVHRRGMAVALKNDGTQAADLEPDFDFVVTEDCVVQEICDEYAPFRAAGKLHVDAEYTDTPITRERMCTVAREQDFTAILKHRSLDAFLQTCD